VALPAEHGGWGLLAEPVLLGLLVAPSSAGLGVALAGLGAFLARQPFNLALADRRRGTRYPRTPVAERLIFLYGGVAAVGLALAWARGGPAWWLPLALAAPLGVVQLAYDADRRSRQLVPELLGGVALGSLAAAELVAAGWNAAPALAVWAILAIKAVGVVLYVRTQLRHDRGLRPDRTAAVASAGLAVILSAALARTGLVPWLATAAFGLFLARALHGLSRFHRPLRPQALGIREMAFGFAFVLIVTLGYALGL